MSLGSSDQNFGRNAGTKQRGSSVCGDGLQLPFVLLLLPGEDVEVVW